MEPRQKTRKYTPVIRVLLFLLLASFLVSAADYVLTPKSAISSAFYAEPRDTIDVLFVGGSHAAAAFDPTQLWMQQGFTGYTFYSWGQPAWTSYHYVKEALKTQSPKVVVVEAFGFMYGRSYLSMNNFDSVSDDFSLQIRPGINRLELAIAMSRYQQAGTPFYRYNSLLRYHGRWKSLTAEDFTWFFTDHYSTDKGFGPVYGHEAFEPQVPPMGVMPRPLYPGCESYLLKLIELSLKEGFQLVLAMTPYVLESPEEWGVIQTIRNICEANDVAFLDYNSQNIALQSEFSMAEDMGEHAHVNQYGAAKITRHIGEYLAANYSLEDRRGQPSLAYWDEAAAIEGWDRTVKHLQLSATAAQWLPRLDNPRFSAVMVLGDMSVPGDSGPLREGLAFFGVNPDALEGNLLMAVEGGNVVLLQTAAAPLRTDLQLAGHGFRLISDGANTQIVMDGQQCALGSEGMQAIVLDNLTGEVLQIVTFIPQEGCITRTDFL